MPATSSFELAISTRFVSMTSTSSAPVSCKRLSHVAPMYRANKTASFAENIPHTYICTTKAGYEH